VFLDQGQCQPDLSVVETMILRQRYLGLKPELCFPIRTLHVDVPPDFLAGEEIETETSIPKDRGAHCTGLRDRKFGRVVLISPNHPGMSSSLRRSLVPIMQPPSSSTKILIAHLFIRRATRQSLAAPRAVSRPPSWPAVKSASKCRSQTCSGCRGDHRALKVGWWERLLHSAQLQFHAKTANFKLLIYPSRDRQ
jgi:hypothetical protein